MSEGKEEYMRIAEAVKNPKDEENKGDMVPESKRKSYLVELIKLCYYELRIIYCHKEFSGRLKDEG